MLPTEQKSRSRLQNGPLLIGWTIHKETLKQLGARSMERMEPTKRQLALLTYLGLSLPNDLTKDQASDMLDAAMEDPRHEERLHTWRTDKLKLHPDLYSEELQAAREGRPQHFYNEMHEWGKNYFYRFTRKQCAEVIRLLDDQYPRVELSIRGG